MVRGRQDGLPRRVGFGPYWFAQNERLALVRHAEIDWVASLKPLDLAQIRVSVDRIGASSFTLRHEIWRSGEDPVLAATCVITYVWFDRVLGEKASLDEAFRAALEAAR